MSIEHPEATFSAAAHPKDILTGYRVGPFDDRAICTGCRRELRAGHSATVYAYRLADSPLWDVPRLYCERCAPAAIETPTLGATEVLATAVLAAAIDPVEGGDRLCLDRVELVAYSDPSEGTAP